MNSMLKNILIFAGIGVVLILVYVFLIKKSPDEQGLISTSPLGVPAAPENSGPAGGVANDFLSLLLGVKNIKLNNAIFSKPAFRSLRDSTIVLTPDGTEGRPNPFAPIGYEGAVSNSVNLPTSSEASPEPSSNPPSTTSGPTSPVN